MDERLLTIDVFVIGQGSEHDGGVAVVGSGDDDGIELISVFGKGLAIVCAFKGVRLFCGGGGEGIGIHITKSGDFHSGVGSDLVAVFGANGADDSDGEDTKF